MSCCSQYTYAAVIIIIISVVIYGLYIFAMYGLGFFFCSIVICLSVSLSVSLSVCMYVCMSIYLCVCLSICLSIYISVCLSLTNIYKIRNNPSSIPLRRDICRTTDHLVHIASLLLSSHQPPTPTPPHHHHHPSPFIILLSYPC